MRKIMVCIILIATLTFTACRICLTIFHQQRNTSHYQKQMGHMNKFKKLIHYR